MSEEIKQELCRLGSLVGTDARNPKENLINFVENLLSQAEEDFKKKCKCGKM